MKRKINKIKELNYIEWRRKNIRETINVVYKRKTQLAMSYMTGLQFTENVRFLFAIQIACGSPHGLSPVGTGDYLEGKPRSWRETDRFPRFIPNTVR
jgi:hypothetical protein